MAILSSVGNGLPDILVSYFGLNKYPHARWTALIEIKDGSKPPSARKLTPDEQKFHDAWQGEIYVISSEDEAENLIKSLG